MRRALLAPFAAIALAGCSSDSGTGKQVKEVAGTVLTLQSGTMTELKETRGNGPFRDYDVPPDEMIEIVTAVLKTKVVAVFPEPRFRQVTAKERTGMKKSDAESDDYSPAFRSAVVVFVHPVPDHPEKCRVEVHSIERGPFHRGTIDWDREVPALIDEAVRKKTTPIRPLSPPAAGVPESAPLAPGGGRTPPGLAPQ